MSFSYGDDKMVRGSEILELYQEAGWTLPASRSPADVEESVRHAAVFVAAREGSRLVGFVSALTDRVYYAHVTEFLVRRSFEGRGIGTELVRRALDALGPERVVTIFADPDAEAFYRRFGFAPTGGGLLLRRG